MLQTTEKTFSAYLCLLLMFVLSMLSGFGCFDLGKVMWCTATSWLSLFCFGFMIGILLAQPIFPRCVALVILLRDHHRASLSSTSFSDAMWLLSRTQDFLAAGISLQTTYGRLQNMLEGWIRIDNRRVASLRILEMGTAKVVWIILC